MLPPLQLPIASVRFVATSATIPNIQDLGDWLGAADVLEFGDELRPVKLHTIVRGYAPTKTDFLFERRLNDHILGVVMEHSQQKPALVFCRCSHSACGRSFIVQVTLMVFQAGQWPSGTGWIQDGKGKWSLQLAKRCFRDSPASHKVRQSQRLHRQ